MLVPIVFVDLPIKNGKARNSHGSGTDTQCLLQYQCLEKRWSLVNPCLSCEKHERSSYIVWLRWFQTWNIMKYLFVAMAISWLCQVSLNHCELMIILFVGGLGWWPLQAIISGLYLQVFCCQSVVGKPKELAVVVSQWIIIGLPHDSEPLRSIRSCNESNHGTFCRKHHQVPNIPPS